MTTRHLSIRVADDLVERLDAEGARWGRSRSEVAKTLIEEGLRMRRHPRIMFRDGPAGRRPGLVHGPDVWEVARIVREIPERGDAAIQKTVELSGLSEREIEAVIRYYAEFRDEIDRWIDLVDEEARVAEAEWRRERALLQR